MRDLTGADPDSPAAEGPAEPVADSAPRVPLGSGSWQLWRDVAVRGAGFPADDLLAICDPELAAAADALDEGSPSSRDGYRRAFTAGTDRLTTEIRKIALQGRFREAVGWQNPALVATCLDRAAAGERRNVRGRNHELTIASYLQRYCWKNDTVGFFGPVGWALLQPTGAGLTAVPGPELVSRRTTYFEYWVLDVLGRRLADRPEVLAGLRPRRPVSAASSGQQVRLPFGRTVRLSSAELRLLERCDGRRTVRELVAEGQGGPTLDSLLRLKGLGALEIDLEFPVSRWPETGLAEQIERIDDPQARSRALAELAELTAARGAVAAAAGDPDGLHRGLDGLAQTFGRITGTAAQRNAGATYAGRTLVYEDAVRDVDVRVGAAVTGALAAPLTLLLDSATWLVNAVAERYLELCGRLVDRLSPAAGGAGVPLLQLLVAVMPEALFPSGTTGSPVVQTVVTEFQQRWQRVLEVPAGVRRHHLVSAGIAAGVAREFATTEPLWSAGRRHSPDVMVAAAGAEAVSQGDFELVLGELHLATNTLESRLFVAQHPQPQRLRAAAEADDLTGRVVSIPRRDGEMVTSRLSRSSVLMLPGYSYLSVGAESVPVPAGARRLVAAELLVRRRGDALVVGRPRDSREDNLVEVLGDLLTMLVVNAFRPLAPAAHRPRVSIDRLVVARESWTFAATAVPWAFVKDEARRYAQARRWQAGHDLPERGFFTVPVERKPMAVDFRSLPLVNLLAKSIRRTVEAGRGTLTMSEMLPDLDRLWLLDRQGRRYTSELRFVAVRDPGQQT